MNREIVETQNEPAEKPSHWRQGPEDEKPFMWASKETLRQIVESPYIDPKELPTALIVYFTLCWLSSDNASNTFEASQGLIAKKCGLHKNTVKNRMSELESTGVVVVTRRYKPNSKERDTNIYRLTSSRRRTPKRLRKTPNVQGYDKRNEVSLSNCRKGVGGEKYSTPISTPSTPPPPAAANTSSLSASSTLGRSTQQKKEKDEIESPKSKLAADQKFAADIAFTQIVESNPHVSKAQARQLVNWIAMQLGSNKTASQIIEYIDEPLMQMIGEQDKERSLVE